MGSLFIDISVFQASVWLLSHLQQLLNKEWLTWVG